MTSEVTADAHSAPEARARRDEAEQADPGWLPAVVQAHADVLDDARPSSTRAGNSPRASESPSSSTRIRCLNTAAWPPPTRATSISPESSLPLTES
jgi:hypothetical protein